MKSKSIFSTKTRDAPLSFRLSFAFTVCHALDTVIHVIGPTPPSCYGYDEVV